MIQHPFETQAGAGVQQLEATEPCTVLWRESQLSVEQVSLRFVLAAAAAASVACVSERALPSPPAQARCSSVCNLVPKKLDLSAGCRVSS